MRFRWADCRLDTESRVLQRQDRSVPIQSLPFDLLVLLLRNRGRLISDPYLRRKLWPDVAVSDASLRQVLKQARRAIGDDGRAQSAIERVRGRGLRFAAPVVSELGDALLFAGRAELLATLEHELDETEADAGGVTLLTGRAGIGKSSTLTEVAARAEVRGWRVITAWAHAGDEANAYALWRQVAEAVGASAEIMGVDDIPASSGISDTHRFARFRALQAALLEEAARSPVLVCLDDLHFADRESLAFLRFLAPALRGSRARILGGNRPIGGDDTSHSSDLAALLADGATHVIELRDLRADEIRSLVGTRLGVTLSASAGDALTTHTSGTPLLALEVVRALRAGGAELEDATADELAANVKLGVRPLLRRRLAALDASARSVLCAAAVIGDSFDADLVCATVNRPREAVVDALRAAAVGGLVECPVPGAYRFAHPLLAEAVRDDLGSQGADAVAALHERALAALESGREPDPFRVAYHALGARERLDTREVLARLRRAARAAWRRHAVADAEIWQARAVEVAEAAGLAPLELCDLLLELGELTIPSGGVVAARVPFDQAARIAREQGDATRLARAALGHAHRAFALDATDSVLAWLRSAQAARCGDAALEARVAARLGAELVLTSPAEHELGEKLLRDGVTRARDTGDPLTLAQVLADQSIARFSAADPRGALALAEEVASCGRHAGDAEIEFRGIVECVTVRLELGDRAGVDDGYDASAALARRTPIPYVQGATHGIAAMLALVDGRLGDAEAAMAASDRLARATGSLGFGVIAGLQRFLLAREQGQVARLLPVLDRASAHLSHVPGLAALAGLAHGLCGNVEPAREAAGALLAGIGSLGRDRTFLATLAVGAELAYLARSASLVRAIEERLAPFEALHAVAGGAATYWGSISHALGFVAAAQGRRPEAIERFARARRAHEAIGSPPWSRRSDAAAAEVRRAGRRVTRVS